jgi:hypothetical protein
MAAATDSIPAPARRLLRAASPCRVLTTDDILAPVIDAAPIALGPWVDHAEPSQAARPAASRHARVLRQHDAGGSPRASQGLVVGFGQRRHGRFSRSVLPIPVRVRS